MTLGEHILQYRTARGWSQEDLADALEVSRQSVSKWETDASTPELDKIVRLSEIFQVSIDELVTGKAPPEPEPEPVPEPVPETGPVASSPPVSPPEAPPRLSAGKIIQIVLGGVFLLVGAVLGIGLLLVNGGYMTLILSTPLLLCGVICLSARRRAALWCGWTLFFWLDCFLRTAVGVTWHILLIAPEFRTEHGLGVQSSVAEFLVLWIAALLFLTAVSYRELRLPPGKENLCKLAALLAAVCILCPILFRFLPPFIVLYGLDLGHFLVSTIQLILLAWAIVLGAAMLRHYKTKRGA